jgi:caffeoyl-CoA O-methyltransferase
MAINSLFNNPNLNQYIDDKSINLSPVALELFDKAKNDEYSQMLSSPNQMQLLSIFIKMIGARNVLEIGTFRGFSTLVMAEALPADGIVQACDISYEYIKNYESFWQKASIAEKIQLNIAPAIETLDKFIEQGLVFDFVYIDADKESYVNYYEKSLQLIKSGGIIAVDNVLWSGKVADDREMDFSTEEIRNLNNTIYNDNRVENCIMSIGDGINLVRKL